ncbi:MULTISPECIES: GyrI-like domain-containing protein [unclassified Paenibacillus]|uniref:GyrI-like domain-containing protein n=1 Tax=unclassified Paenibacillus TaxID=185978 RepID=UPI00288310C2|nr:GyrI-like domain-containing protein [Paenibacillus sp. p3-SID1389]
MQGPVPTAFVNTYRQIYSEWLPSNGYVPAELPTIEAYISQDLYSPNSKNEIWPTVK